MNVDGLDRRELFRILGGAVAAEALYAQHAHTELVAGGSPRNAEPRFFTNAEYGLLDALSDLLIPADDQSAGARAAQVPWFIDTVLLYADKERQQKWRSGLTSVDDLAKERFQTAFLQCRPEDRLRLMDALTENEDDPQKPAQKFFQSFKAAVVEAFAFSEIGMQQYFHYRGNTALTEFVGCRPGD